MHCIAGMGEELSVTNEGTVYLVYIYSYRSQSE